MSRLSAVPLLSMMMVFVAGCGTGGVLDRHADDRARLMSSELAWTVRPSGGGAGGVGSTGSMSGDGLGAVRESIGAEAQFWVDQGLDADDLTDFYLDLFAKQRHRNISVGCSTEPEGRRIDAVAWAGKYGYMISVQMFRKSLVKKGALEPLGGPSDPMFVWIEVNGNKKMYKGNAEDPVNACSFYELPRMTNVFYPYGISPFDAPSGWLPFHYPLGERDPYRKTPPRVTPTFIPTTIPAVTSSSVQGTVSP